MTAPVPTAGGTRRGRSGQVSDRYKWVALINTTMGMLMATIDGSILLISLPDIFRGINLDPLQPGNSFYLLWMILSFLVVTSVLVVNLGRLGDIYGRVRMYNLGFAIFTFFSLLLTITWMHGAAAGLWLIIVRVFQGVGAAFLVANSSAIITDAFPEHQRGMALGINQAAGISGTFIGLVLGGILAPINWRLIFLVSVPVGLFGTVWGYLQLREVGRPSRAHIDWPGNLTFAFGLISLMIGITYGIEPYGGHTMGWTSPAVLSELGAGVGLLIAFAIIESRVAEPMFRLPLFRIRAFTAGVLASFLAAVGRGGLMFMLIIWLQGIWLPLHGFDFARTPLWAGIAMLPLTTGFLISGPLAGILSDRYGARPFATGGMVGSAASFVALELLPVNFSYWVFGVILLAARAHHGVVRLSQPGRGHEQPPSPAPRRGIGDELHLSELRPGAVHRHLLHPCDRGPLRLAARHHVPRPGRRGRACRCGRPGGAPSPGVHLVRRFLGVQPDAAPAGHGRAVPSPGGPRRGDHGPKLLPQPHLGALPARAPRRVRLRHHRLPRGGGGIVVAGREVRVRRARRAGAPARRHRPPNARARGRGGPRGQGNAMTVRRDIGDPAPSNGGTGDTLRIGEVAKLCGVTTRTLRYWEEIGLLEPSSQRHGGERVYSGPQAERARRIRELQELVGFSLAEIRVVLETEDVLDKLRNAYKNNARAELQRGLLANAIEANDKLVARLDDIIGGVTTFRDERVAKAARLRARALELDSALDPALDPSAGEQR